MVPCWVAVGRIFPKPRRPTDFQYRNSLIKADLGLTDYDIGDVVMIFTAVYGILVPISGFLGDLISRKWIVIWSLLIFSGGTLCTGLSGGIVMLIVFRSVATRRRRSVLLSRGDLSIKPAALPHPRDGSFHTPDLSCTSE